MNPIIEPSIIYAMSVIHNLDMVCNALFAFTILGFLCILAGFVVKDFKLGETEKRFIRPLTIAFGILLFPIIFIPDEKTMLAMLTASFVTPDNIAVSEEHIVELVQKIVEEVAKAR